jgi:hypothetical protein
MKIYKFVAFSTFFLSLINIVSALQITEVQFQPSGTESGREWVEVFNDGSNSIDFSKYRFFEANMQHSLATVSSETLEPGEYAVVIQNVTKFFADFPNFTGKVFTSSFSLVNYGEPLAFRSSAGGPTVASYTYSPSTTGAGDGASEQLVSGTWTKGTPSPGAENIAQTPVDPVATTTTSTTTIPTSTTTTETVATTSTTTTFVTATVTEIVEIPKIVYVQKSYWPASEKIYVSAGENKLAITGSEVKFLGRVLDGDKKTSITTGEFHWSFGDGYEMLGSRETKHVYRFPGEYTAIFQASSGDRLEEDRIYVKVVNPDVTLQMGHDDVDYIQITNNNNEELKLDGLQLVQLDVKGLVVKRFSLPKNFSVLPKRSVKIAQDLTGFAQPVSAVALEYISGVRLTQALNPNYRKELRASLSAPLSTSSVVVTLPGAVLPNQLAGLDDKTETITTPITATNSTTKTIAQKPLKTKTTFTNKAYTTATKPATTTTTKLVAESSPVDKVILSKPDTGLWQGVKSFLGI